MTEETLCPDEPDEKLDEDDPYGLLESDADFNMDSALNSTPEFPLPRNAAEYTRIYRKLQGSTVHKAMAEEFYLLCLLRVGAPDANNLLSWSMSNSDEVAEFRDAAYPDYYVNPRLPVIDAGNYVRWYFDKTRGDKE